MHAHVHARGAPSTNRWPGSSYRAHVREHHGFSYDILALPLGTRYVHRWRSSLSPSLSLSLFTPLSSPPYLTQHPSLASCRVPVCVLFFLFPSSTPSPFSCHSLYILYLWEEGIIELRGKFDWKARITRSSRRGRPTAAVREEKLKGLSIQGTRLINARVPILTRKRQKWSVNVSRSSQWLVIIIEAREPWLLRASFTFHSVRPKQWFLATGLLWCSMLLSNDSARVVTRWKNK